MIRGVRTFIFMVILLGGRGLVYAEPQIDVSLSAQKIPANQTVTLQIRAQWPKAEAQYAFALPELSLKNLSVVNQAESQETFRQGQQEWTRKIFLIDLKPGQSGEGIVKAFVLPYVDPALQKGGRFEVPDQRVRVTPPPVSALIVTTGVLIPSTIILFALFRFYVRKRTVTLKTKLPQSLEEGTLEKMKAIVSKPHASNPKTWAYELAGEFQTFLARYYKISSERAVEKEIFEILTSQGASSEEIKTLRRLLERLHEAKFAGGEISAAEFYELQKDVMRYVEAKRPVGAL